MIIALLTFAVSVSVFAAHSLVVAARADHSRLGTAIDTAKSVAHAAKANAFDLLDAIKLNAAAAQQVRATAPAAPRATTRRKACTLKV